MVMPLFSFTTPSQQQDPSAGIGMQQYNQQGGGQIDPGRSPANQGSQAPALGQALMQMAQQQAQKQAGDAAAAKYGISPDGSYGASSPAAQMHAGQNFMWNSSPSTDSQWQSTLDSQNPSMMSKAGSWLSNLFSSGGGSSGGQ